MDPRQRKETPPRSWRDSDQSLKSTKEKEYGSERESPRRGDNWKSGSTREWGYAGLKKKKETIRDPILPTAVGDVDGNLHSWEHSGE